MKTWLCTNLANYLGPQQGPARLYAYLKKQGMDVAFKDLNKDAYFTLLSQEYLGKTIEKLTDRVDSAKRSRFLREDIGALLVHSSNAVLKQLLAKGIMVNSRWSRYLKNGGIAKQPLAWFIDRNIKYDNILYALISEQKFVLSEIDKANDVLDKEFFNLEPDDFIANFSTLLCGKAIIDAAYFPAQLDFGLGFYGTAYSPSAKDVLTSMSDEKHNFLLPYLQGKIAPQISGERPDIVGISISHPSEFFPAFTLAGLVRRHATGSPHLPGRRSGHGNYLPHQ